MRIASLPLLLLGSVLVLASCDTSPTQEDIEREIEEQLSSVAGPWAGFSSGTNPIQIEFTLQQGAGGQVTGTGTMREQSATASVPITVTGTFARPRLSLTFGGMVYEGRAVQGTFAGDYTSVGGVTGSLMLAATDYSRSLPVLIQER